MKGKKNIKLILLLCANIVFFLSWLIALLCNGGYFGDYWVVGLILQCFFTLLSVALYYLIDLTQTVKKLLSRSESGGSPSVDDEGTEQ